MPNHPDVEEALSAIGQRDHSITGEYRIFGPPGTGKTTNLTRQIRRAVERFGKDSVLVTSFSRAAAAELAGQDLPVSPDRVGTLHSHCWHALGRPEIAEVHVEEWNRANPHLRITPAKKDRKLDGEESDEESVDDVRSGDYWLGELNRSRGMMRPVEVWPAALREFAAKWSRYKASRRVMDFCDLIETAMREIRIAPKRPDVIFADEAQDLNPMQLTLGAKVGRERAVLHHRGRRRPDHLLLVRRDAGCGVGPRDSRGPQDHPQGEPPSAAQRSRAGEPVDPSSHPQAGKGLRSATRRRDVRAHLARRLQIARVLDSQDDHAAPRERTEGDAVGVVLLHVASGDRGAAAMGHPFSQPVPEIRTASGIHCGMDEKDPRRTGFCPCLATHPWTHRDLKLWAEWLNPKGNLRTGRQSADRGIRRFAPGDDRAAQRIVRGRRA